MGQVESREVGEVWKKFLWRTGRPCTGEGLIGPGDILTLAGLAGALVELTPGAPLVEEEAGHLCSHRLWMWSFFPSQVGLLIMTSGTHHNQL